MANAIYQITLASSRSKYDKVSGALVFAGSSTDAIDFAKGLHPEVPASVWAAATAAIITAAGGMATDCTGLSLWVDIGGTRYYADAKAGNTQENLMTPLCAAINQRYPGMATITTPGVTTTPAVITIAAGANVGKAVMSAGVGTHNGGARINGGTYQGITSLLPTVNAVQGSDAAARTITYVAPSSVAIPAGFTFDLRAYRTPFYNDDPADAASSGDINQYGADQFAMPVSG